MGQKDLPVASAREHQRAFERLGWEVARVKNHIVMTRKGSTVTLSIPNHDEVKRTVIAKLLVAAGIAIEDYCRAFRGK